MRSLWTGAIGFGLVNIPVKLYSAVQESRLDLDMLDKHDKSRIRYVRVNEETGHEVEWKDIVKGYKYRNKYVVLTEDDFEKASPKKSKMIEIASFVEQDSVDSTLYEMPYYLEPSKGGEKAYTLLREALKKSEKVAVGSFMMRSREHVCLLMPHGHALLLMRLRFAEEIRAYDDLSIPGELAVKPAELKMAVALIEHLSPKKFDIAKLKDTYDKELLKIVKIKAGGKDLPEPKFKLVHSKSKDLMAQLKLSLEGGKTRKKAS